MRASDDSAPFLPCLLAALRCEIGERVGVAMATIPRGRYFKEAGGFRVSKFFLPSWKLAPCPVVRWATGRGPTLVYLFFWGLGLVT